jgi:aminoglycoside phosphotransferase (APT) family kinase protein
VELQRQGQIIEELDRLWNQLLMGAPLAQRSLSFNLYQAALTVAIHGCDEIPAQLAGRANNWRAGKMKRNRDESSRFRTAHAAKHSEKSISRATVVENAYEEVAKRESITPITAEKRRYRKPKR